MKFYPVEDDLIQQLQFTVNSLCVEALYHRYSKKVYQKCLKMTKSGDDAYDLSQEVWIKVMKNISKFQHKCHYSTWIYSITHNHCIDHLRKTANKKNQKYKYINNSNNETLTIPDNVFERVNAENKDHVYDMILEFSQNDKLQILWLKYGQGMTVKKIAEQMGISHSAVKMRIQRAKTTFRKEMREEMKQRKLLPGQGELDFLSLNSNSKSNSKTEGIEKKE